MANFFDWDPKTFGLGVAAMDQEHQQLIGYMNRLHALYVEKAPRAAIGKALTDLAQFTVKHFTDEEAYMASVGFPELKTHAIMHKTLLERVGGFVADFQKTGQLTDAFFAFLKMWLKAHICGIDIKYAKHPKAA
jgi:hemerythrin-like metal-binding protein